MGKAYTYSTWIVKPGHEDEFIRLWTEWTEWSTLQGLASATLLRDVDQPNRFVSFGPWAGIESVGSWRAAEGYHERIAALQALLETFEPHTLEQVAET